MRIALAQVTSGPDPADNLRMAEDWIGRAAARDADVVVFPEALMCSFGNALVDVAQPVDGPWASRLVDLARHHGVSVVAGMFTPAQGNRVRNTLVLAGPDGTVAAYDKVHLFDAFGFRESDHVAAGQDLVVVQVAGLGIGLATCYDVRFPGMFTRLAELGADVIVVAASWGAGPGKVEQWDLLTRARALDATVFVAACGQAAPPGPVIGSAPVGVGHSAVISPWGTPLGSLGPGPDLLVVDVDPADLHRAREALPVLANARYRFQDRPMFQLSEPGTGGPV